LQGPSNFTGFNENARPGGITSVGVPPLAPHRAPHAFVKAFSIHAVIVNEISLLHLLKKIVFFFERKRKIRIRVFTGESSVLPSPTAPKLNTLKGFEASPKPILDVAIQKIKTVASNNSCSVSAHV
jgi:hypothetical protein